ncbi:hypothetical protein PsorP6_019489 [Peronosclerospora sorghi]|nr:hypothetical protein PsorP6_019489 [Peronosclerospora sorghi]
MEERGSLETQLENTRALLAAKSDELKEAAEILNRYKEDRAVSRAKVDDQVSERNGFTRELMDQWSTNRPHIEQTKKALACLMTTKKKIELSSKRNKKNKEKKIEEMEAATSDRQRVELVSDLGVDSVNTKEEDMMYEMLHTVDGSTIEKYEGMEGADYALRRDAQDKARAL